MISGKGRGGGAGRPGPELGGGGAGGPSLKNIFCALRGSVWSRLGSLKNI